MSAPDPYYVLVPRWAVKALVGPATIQEQGRARRALEAALAPVPAACCDLHGVHCEPPSELCCERCSEARHPRHPAGVRCVLDFVPPEYVHPFEQSKAVDNVRVCICGKWPDHHDHTGDRRLCGCDDCRLYRSERVPDAQEVPR